MQARPPPASRHPSGCAWDFSCQIKEPLASPTPGLSPAPSSPQRAALQHVCLREGGGLPEPSASFRAPCGGPGLAWPGAEWGEVDPPGEVPCWGRNS